ncbi:protein ZNRD2 isoform X1 [Dasypus novemcinctus]|uniref:protein ZNRD2 isoform X1 n=1 Tax=Dasypus novemcinctus TaxID=9361 RepID=UPI000328A868|nr:protein ZNRD2 isoform X1 [Dasypus novemcinctus]
MEETGPPPRAPDLCVTSGELNGNMALNGAGEDLGCGGLWLRGPGSSRLRQEPPVPCASLPPEVDDFSWEPPTEAETKVLQARRERQDRISRLMGDYLLRGYRMLGETCAECGTILLQDKQRKIYCVACQELDSDVDKDNPALNAQAALSQAREHQLASASELPSGSRPTPQPPAPRPEHCEGAAAGLKAAQAPSPPAVPPNADVLACTQGALLQKLTWASAELGSSTSLESSIQLCGLIRACAEALHSLQQLQH